MKKALCSVALAMAISAVGCANKKTAGIPRSESVADISAPAPLYQAPAPQPVAQPVVYDTMTTTATPAMSNTGTVGGGSYTVKKGDTLYSIARARYGDGKQWNKIVSANPGLSPQSLKVGQTIQVP